MFVLFIALLACKRISSDSPKATSSASPSGAGTAPVAASAAEPPSSTTSAGSSAKAENADCLPFRRRCDDACRNAHFQALETCKAESEAFLKLVPDQKVLGECSAHCLTSKNTTGCVGAATKAECECQFKCSDGLPSDARKKGEVYIQCYDKAVAAACR